MRGRGEIIRLDGTVVGVITNAVFRAELANGHRLVAYAAPADRRKAAALRPEARVRLEMSPFDMSKGRIVFEQEEAAG